MSVFASVLRCLLGCGRWSLRAAEVLRNPRERAALKIYLAFLARRYFRNLKRDLPSTFMEVWRVVVTWKAQTYTAASTFFGDVPSGEVPELPVVSVEPPALSSSPAAA